MEKDTISIAQVFMLAGTAVVLVGILFMWCANV